LELGQPHRLPHEQRRFLVTTLELVQRVPLRPQRFADVAAQQVVGIISDRGEA
jgi:hypothetical protein